MGSSIKTKVKVNASERKFDPRHPDNLVLDNLAVNSLLPMPPLLWAIGASDMSRNAKIAGIGFLSVASLSIANKAYKGFVDYQERRPRDANGYLIKPGFLNSAAATLVSAVSGAAATALIYHAQKSGIIGDTMKGVGIKPMQYLAIAETALSTALLSIGNGISRGFRSHAFSPDSISV